MNAVTPTSDPIQSARQLLKDLQSQFPVFRDALPLAIGIDKQIVAQLPATDRKVLRIALGIHTKSTRYLKQTERTTNRVNLDGSPAEAIAEAHRTRATEMLRERYKKMAEQHKAQRQAEEAARKMNEKLNQLATKFSRPKS
jgi:ProP effector